MVLKVSLTSAQAQILAAERAKSRLETFLTLLLAEKSAAYTSSCILQIVQTIGFSVRKSELKQNYVTSPSLPFRLSVEESTGWVDIDHLLINQCPITLLGILLCSISEEAAADGLLDSNRCLATGHHIQLVSVREELGRTRKFRVLHIQLELLTSD